MNRTFDEYIFEGKWDLEEHNLTAEQFYDELTPDLSDLIDDLTLEIQEEGFLIKWKISFYLRVFNVGIGDKYRKFKVNISNLENEEINIVRADYYGYLKCYCLNFTQASIN